MCETSILPEWQEDTGNRVDLQIDPNSCSDDLRFSEFPENNKNSEKTPFVFLSGPPVLLFSAPSDVSSDFQSQVE